MKKLVFLTAALLALAVAGHAQYRTPNGRIVGDRGISSQGGPLGPDGSDCAYYDEHGVQGCVRTSDVAPDDMVVTGQTAYPPASTNKTGGDLRIAPGLGSKTVTIDDYNNCAGDTVTVRINDTNNVLTEGVSWTAATSNDATAASLALAINALTGVTSTSSGAVASVTKDRTTAMVTLSEGDVTCTTVANNTDGYTRFYNDIYLDDGSGSYNICLNSNCSLRVYGQSSIQLGILASSQSVLSTNLFETRVYNDLNLDESVWHAQKTIAANDTTPDCGDATIYSIADGTGAWTITGLDDVTAGQLIHLRMGATATNSPTIIDDDSTFFLTEDWTPGPYDYLVLEAMTSSTFAEVSRRMKKIVSFTVSSGSAILGPTAPSWSENDSCTGLDFGADSERVHINFEVPDCWDGATDLVFKTYWCPENGDAPQLNETVKWDIRYRSLIWGTEDADNGTIANGTVTYTETANPGDDKDTIVSTITLNDVNQPISSGDVLAVDFDRDVTGDTYSGSPIVHHWEFDIVTDTGRCDHY